MARKKGKSISFDAMVKFFLHTYQIPTTRDVDKLMARLDRLESLISAVPAAEAVLETIKRSKQGLKFADIQTKTGFADKKIRNIIFRLNKLGKIKRHSRGVYIAIG